MKSGRVTRRPSSWTHPRASRQVQGEGGKQRKQSVIIIINFYFFYFLGAFFLFEWHGHANSLWPFQVNHEIRTLLELVKTSSRNCHLVWMIQNKLGHIRDHKIHTPKELKQIPLSNYWFPRHRINLFGWHDIQIKHRHFKRSWDRTLWEKWITENSAKLFFFKWFSMEKLTFLLTINTFSEFRTERLWERPVSYWSHSKKLVAVNYTIT